jgi:hypothetical protein
MGAGRSIRGIGLETDLDDDDDDDGVVEEAEEEAFMLVVSELCLVKQVVVQAVVE